jgi:DTW domain-containing protein YfiP
MLAAMSLLPAVRRATCATCLRPQPTCICRWITRTGTAIEVLVLQHPLEVGNAKGSARLLHLSLPGSALVAGEVFDPATLAGLLHEGGRTPLLLYPDTVDQAAPLVRTPPRLDPAMLADPARLRLVVLDGTWRKSRKMLYLNPLLQGLPRLALQDMPASHYRIRKAHAPDQLSTLEAAAYALMRLDGGQARFAPLIDAFDGFVAQQAARAPA